MFRIYFSDIGNVNWSGELEVEAETLGEVETIALLECRKRLSSKYAMLHYIDDLCYEVMTGFNYAGKIKIRSL